MSNDALGNIAVIIAAGRVARLRSAWRDLIVAAMFLQSAWEILRNATAERQEAREAAVEFLRSQRRSRPAVEPDPPGPAPLARLATYRNFFLVHSGK